MSRSMNRMAFTLIELLVVLTIIVVLLSLLAPAMDRAMEAAQRAVCASHLDAIHHGATLYAMENKNTLFICRGRQVQTGIDTKDPPVPHRESQYNRPNDNSVDWLAAMGTVGLADGPHPVSGGGLQYVPTKVWDCPSRRRVAGWVASAQQGFLGYQYFGGIERWTNAYGLVNGEARSPLKLSKSAPGWALAADATFRFNRTWGEVPPSLAPWYNDIPPHPRDKSLVPDGHNQVFMDGSAVWLAAHQLIFIHSWGNQSPNFEAFWYQSDLGNWDPPDDAYAIPRE